MGHFLFGGINVMKIKDIFKRSRLLRPIYGFVRKKYYDVYWYPFEEKIKKSRENKIVFYEGYGKLKGHKLEKSNWGDDLNKFFFEEITKMDFVLIPFSHMSRKYVQVHYSLIGSIIGFFDLSNTIIYGSGIIDSEIKISGVPLKILSVRGPKTREVLLKNNIDCPEKYGDPALLLPVYYKPRLLKSNKGCVIPNMGTHESNSVLLKLVNEYGLDLIDMTKYDKWTDIIDKIANSKFVISESLHGLIVAETYNIPNIWVELKKHPDYWDFKFQDFYESIGKKEQSVKLYEEFDFEVLTRKIHDWNQGEIDYDSLMQDCPFIH
jgi:pyruvyltransferase